MRGDLQQRSLAGRATAFLLTISVAAFGASTAFAPPAAGIDPVEIVVDTEADTGLDACTLRAAIVTANGGHVGTCGFGTGLGDTIFFGRGVDVINVLSALPTITKPMMIHGGAGSGRVQLHGPGSGNGLTLSDTADGAFIRGLVIDNFTIGINSSASDVTFVANVLGPNAQYGILAFGDNIHIGGTSGVTPGGPCTGDCNLISGNSWYGVIATGSTGDGVIQGNFIGTNAAGTAATANGLSGILLGGTWTIGGTGAGAGNVISGNGSRGISAQNCMCTIQGNLIGTSAAGVAALPNGAGGITLNVSNGSVVGGATAGAGNVISGNASNGIEVLDSDNVSIYRNRIGTAVGGGPLGNTGDGIYVHDGASASLIGSAITPAYSNTIAFNGGAGVRIVHGPSFASVSNQVRGNSIHDNGGAGIVLSGGANAGIGPPTITGVGQASGTACANCTVDIYSDSADEGRVFEGFTTADGSGHWTFPGTVTGPNITATNTDANGNTSAFSTPFPAAAFRPDGRIKKGTSPLIGNNIYNSDGTGQTKSGKAVIGTAIKFTISIENDASGSDKFKVAATGSAAANYSVKFFKGTTNITTAVVAGTYQTTTLAPGTKFGIIAKVKVLAGATIGSSVTRLVTITSLADNTKVDAVKFVGMRK